MSEKEIVTLARVMFGRIKPVWKSTREPGAPDNILRTPVGTATPSSRNHEDGVEM